MWSVVFLVFFFFFTAINYVTMSEIETITYFSVERPKIMYVNSKYLTYINLTSKQYSRRDPIHYVNLHIQTAVVFNNSFGMDYYFWEFLTNRYKPSFVEMHFRLCNLIHKDKFFGAAMRLGKLTQPCPYPPGEYSLTNMTVAIEAIPKGFPFTKGRIFLNMTYIPKKELVANGYIDMELKTLKRKKNPK